MSKVEKDEKLIPLLYRVEREFVITYISMFLDELINEGIITRGQKAESLKYIHSQYPKGREQSGS